MHQNYSHYGGKNIVQQEVSLVEHSIKNFKLADISLLGNCVTFYYFYHAHD